MGVEWFDKLFQDKQDANQKKRYDDAYTKKEREILERLDKQIETTDKKLKKVVELLKEADGDS